MTVKSIEITQNGLVLYNFSGKMENMICQAYSTFHHLTKIGCWSHGRQIVTALAQRRHAICSCVFC